MLSNTGGYFENTTPPYASAFGTGFGHDGTCNNRLVDPSSHAADSNIMSLGYPGVHNTPSNQGQGLQLTSNPYLASIIEEIAPLDDYGATDAAYDAIHETYDAIHETYGAIHATYGATNTVYGDASAAYAASTDTGDLTRGIWPSTDPVSTSMGYDYGVAYPLVNNPTLAPGNLTTTPVQAGYEPAVTNTDSSRPQCSTCNTTFKRASDLARHEKKHQARRAFKCLVPGCTFKGSYRKDKLDAHVRSCHPGGAA